MTGPILAILAVPAALVAILAIGFAVSEWLWVREQLRMHDATWPLLVAEARRSAGEDI